MEKTLGDVIKDARIDCNMTQRELADAIKVSKSYINKIEHDQTKKPRFEVLDRLSLVLGLQFLDIVEMAGYDIGEIKLWEDLKHNVLNYKYEYFNDEIKNDYIVNDNIDIYKVIDDCKSKRLGDLEAIYLFTEWLKPEKYDISLVLEYILKHQKK